MNIIYIVPLGGIGGAEKIAYNLASYFSKNHKVSMVFLKGPLDDSFNVDDGIKKYVLDMQGVLDVPKTLIKIFNIFKNEKPDLVHTHIFYSHVVARILKPFFNYKLISSEHGSITKYSNPPIYQKILNNLLKKNSNYNTNVCDEAIQTYINAGYYNKNEIFTVYNGIDESKFCTSLDLQYLNEEFDFLKNSKIFLAVGRLSHEKNFEMLIRAFHILIVSKNINAKLLIVGDGELRSFLLDLVFQLNMQNDIIFLGKRFDVANLMQFCDVYCLSSTFEGLPTVLLEAVFSKISIVSTKCCGVQEILGDYSGCSEVLDVQAFALNMYVAALEDNSLIIEKRYNRAKNIFTLEAMNLFWEKKYCEIIKE